MGGERGLPKMDVRCLAGPEDDAWHRTVDLTLAPRPGLSLDIRRVVEQDYIMMEGGSVTISVREALAYYLWK